MNFKFLKLQNSSKKWSQSHYYIFSLTLIISFLIHKPQEKNRWYRRYNDVTAHEANNITCQNSAPDNLASIITYYEFGDVFTLATTMGMNNGKSAYIGGYKNIAGTPPGTFCSNFQCTGKIAYSDPSRGSFEYVNWLLNMEVIFLFTFIAFVIFSTGAFPFVV